MVCYYLYQVEGEEIKWLFELSLEDWFDGVQCLFVKGSSGKVVCLMDDDGFFGFLLYGFFYFMSWVFFVCFLFCCLIIDFGEYLCFQFLWRCVCQCVCCCEVYCVVGLCYLLSDSFLGYMKGGGIFFFVQGVCLNWSFIKGYVFENVGV